MAAPILTVAVCTLDRPRLLRLLLEDLLATPLRERGCEVLVVDNGTDVETRATVEAAATRGPVRYVAEPQRGLSHARNRAWKSTDGEYVAYLDDDCRVAEDWVDAALRVISELRPEAFGGPYHAAYETTPPAWFKDEYGSHAAGPRPRSLGPGEYLSGGNLVVRRDVVASLGGFSADLGMRGRALGYGEETDLLRRLRATIPAAVVHYEPALGVRHLVRPEKYRWTWQLCQRWVDGRSYARVTAGEHPAVGPVRFVASLGLWAVRLAARLLRGLRRDRSEHPYYRNWLYEEVLDLVRDLGGLAERTRLGAGTSSGRRRVRGATRRR